MPDIQVLRYTIPFILPLVLLGVFVFRTYNTANYTDYMGTGVVEGTILKHPYIKNGRQAFQVGNLTVMTGLYPKYKLGDMIRVITNEDKAVLGIVYYPHLEVTGHIGFLNKISDFRDRIIRKIQKLLPEPHADLVLGMTIGHKDDVPSSFNEMLKKVGIIHVVVVSGYNVSLVLTLVGIILIRLGRAVFFAGSIIVLFVFLLIAGLDPPIIRAVIMGSISTLALVLGEYKRTLYLLILSAFMMLAVNPRYISDISFQMTFMATMTVVLVSPLARGLPVVLQETLIIFSVNIAMIPLISYYFGSFSLLGLVSNILLLWEVPFITVLGIVLMISPFAMIKIVFIALLDYFLLICEAVDKLNFGVFQYQMNLPAIMVYYFVFTFVLRVLYLVKADSTET